MVESPVTGPGATPDLTPRIEHRSEVPRRLRRRRCVEMSDSPQTDLIDVS